MKNKKINLLILLIFILIVFLLISKFWKENKINFEENDFIYVNGKKILTFDGIYKRIGDEYKNSEDFTTCVYMDKGVGFCLSELINKKIEEEKNPKYCNDYLYDKEKENCERNFYLKDAITNLSVEKCSYLPDKTYVEFCEERIYTIKAIKNNDPGYCNNLSDWRSKACKMNYIFEKAKNDPNRCNEIEDEEVMKYCKEEVENYQRMKKEMELLNKES